ncbi:phospholipid/cholesterol/gamma-HCH transport system ATP-binding protein [Flavobacterium fluvii]|uniref:Phospholipid/cholesterol/gamma-HCH transport system ATP-binding protein n=1 Tax=Flavobacterium fluvii TaxID=468056 RepID=A0A1M5KI32_9FLAO|nr:ATP-binding cassette domain-containing protein [Flavobacterium fluvii]SHG52280.1 phospholipid/cholesterol/gamma-HCH transport system ATP-binding protein [Flavobacterium fluvii]
METQPVIVIKDLYKTFGENEVLKGINLSVNKGENLVILGRSGSGKSVTIKCLVGLVKADKGEIKIFDEEVSALNDDDLNNMRVNIGFMFQNGALYDSMSVRQNLKFALKHHTRNLAEPEIESKIMEALENVGLAESIDKMPSELSGGMKKRIALARAIIIKPKIILYDEPTSGLDTITSREISELILSVQEKYKASSIIITHDMACAKTTGNRILILNEGEITAEGSYEELEKSKDEWVHSFFI